MPMPPLQLSYIFLAPNSVGYVFNSHNLGTNLKPY
jgi:hypothetical protein